MDQKTAAKLLEEDRMPNLYQWPFANVSGAGGVCYGSNNIRKIERLSDLDILPILAGVLLMAGFVFFVRLRVNSIATILSFERNAQTMADLSSAIIGMGCTLAAVIMTIISSFFRTVREEK